MAGRGGGGGYEVPAGLQELLIEFTVAVLVERPSDLLAYASEYFNRMYEDRLKQPTQPSESEESMITDEDDDEPMPGKVRSDQVASLQGPPLRPSGRARGEPGPGRPPWTSQKGLPGPLRTRRKCGTRRDGSATRADEPAAGTPWH